MLAFRESADSPLILTPETDDENDLINSILYVARGGGWITAIPEIEVEESIRLHFDGDPDYLEDDNDSPSERD